MNGLSIKKKLFINDNFSRQDVGQSAIQPTCDMRQIYIAKQTLGLAAYEGRGELAEMLKFFLQVFKRA